MSNFLIPIQAPALNSPTFARDIQEIFENINENFRRMASAPYLEGQEGKSVTTVDMPIVENDELTEFGIEMCRVIFNDNNIDSISYIDNVVAQPITNIKVTDYLKEHPIMKVMATYDPDTDAVNTYLCGAEYYYFVDERISEVSDDISVHAYASSFTDYSCVIFAQYNDGWTFSKGTMMPTLYYNDALGYFCWQVNGIETTIRAQGIKGDTGKPSVTAVVKGTGAEISTTNDEKLIRVVVDGYAKRNITINPDTLEASVDDSWDDDMSNSDLQNGDLVCCLFYVNDIPDMLIGNIIIDNNSYSIIQPSSTRFSNLWRSYLLYDALKDIDYKTTGTSTLKAVFIPAKSSDVTHALFQDDSMVDYHVVPGTSPVEYTVSENGTRDNLVIKKVNTSRLVGYGARGNDNRLTETDDDTAVSEQTELKVIGYDLNVDGIVTGNVSRIGGVELGVPVGCVMNWIDMNHIPEGWYRTGDVNNQELHVPVFKLQDHSDTSYDVVILGRGFTKYLIFTDPETNERNTKFSKIFCALTGNDYQSPIAISTDETSFSNYFYNDGFGWTETTGFDCTYISETDSILFYLTKYTIE